MGMYTEVFFRAELRADTPEWIIGVLSCMADGGSCPVEVPYHPLFGGTRWMTMFRQLSKQFPRASMCRLSQEDKGTWHFGALSSFKNYGDEFEHFCDWIAPHVDAPPGTFLGYSLFEQHVDPTLVYLGDESRVVWVDAPGPPGGASAIDDE